MSGVETTSCVTDTGLADDDGAARREEERWKKQFEKKRIQAGEPPEPVEKKPPPISSGFTVEGMEREIKEAAERKKKREEDEKQAEIKMREEEKRLIEQARANFEKASKEGHTYPPTPEMSGVERSFMEIKIGEMLKEKPIAPSWVIDELKCGKKFSQRVLDQLNFVRTTPLEYAARLRTLLPFFTPRTAGGIQFQCAELRADEPLFDGQAGIAELIGLLEKMKPIGALQLESALSTSCLDLAEIQGPSGLEGLEGETDEQRKKRFFTYCKTVNGRASQVLSYGPYLPVHIVLNMLLDDSKPERARRNDILNPEWKIVGIYGAKHARKTFMTVALFAEGIIT